MPRTGTWHSPGTFRMAGRFFTYHVLDEESEYQNVIPKYTRPTMGAIWSYGHTLELWLQVEVAVAAAWNSMGHVPDRALAAIRQSTFDEEEIARYEEDVQHDLIAFLLSVNDGLGDAARFLHIGLTSNDVKDTALSLQLVESLREITKELEALRSTIRRLAIDHKKTLMMGRTHGVHAEPITFGFKAAVWYSSLGRSLDRLAQLSTEIAVAKLAGAVGTHSNVPPEVEEFAARELGLCVAPAETQVIQRDRHARYVLELGVLGSVIDSIATEIRMLQRTEVREVQEPFGEAQAGSSAMPHKRNPVLCERLTGLARLLRGFSGPALENVVLWGERDISNSSLERVMLPDASMAADYAVALLNRILTGLTVFPDRMKANMESTHGLVFSQRVVQALVDSGLPRDEAYRIVQRDSLRAFDDDTTFESILSADAEIHDYLSGDEIRSLFDYGHFERNIDATYKRLGLD